MITFQNTKIKVVTRKPIGRLIIYALGLRLFRHAGVRVTCILWDDKDLTTCYIAEARGCNIIPRKNVTIAVIAQASHTTDIILYYVRTI